MIRRRKKRKEGVSNPQGDRPTLQTVRANKPPFAITSRAEARAVAFALYGLYVNCQGIKTPCSLVELHRFLAKRLKEKAK